MKAVHVILQKFLCFVIFFAIAFTANISSSYAKQDPTPPPWRTWQSTLDLDHPLVGKIYSTQEKEYITPGQLVSRLAYRDYSLLGETHDNPDHHQLQAWLIKNIIGYDRRPALVFEMLEQAQNQKLQRYLRAVRSRQKKQPAGNFGPAFDWEKRGWPSWKIYQPLAEIAFSYKLKIAYGSPTRSDVKAVVKKGLSHLAPAQRTKLGLRSFLVAPLTRSMKEELSSAHCYMLPNSVLVPMATAQRFKDATMADRLIAAGLEKGAILIAGSGHVRKDRGVPYYLKKRVEDARLASLSIQEVRTNEKKIDQYIVKDKKGRAAVDFIWLTPRKKRQDPCEALKKHLRK